MSTPPNTADATRLDSFVSSASPRRRCVLGIVLYTFSYKLHRTRQTQICILNVHNGVFFRRCTCCQRRSTSCVYITNTCRRADITLATSRYTVTHHSSLCHGSATDLSDRLLQLRHCAGDVCVNTAAVDQSFYHSAVIYF